MIEGAPNDTMLQQHHHQGEPSQSQASPSPSFSSYSSETLAEIAARVINELRRHPQNDDDNDNGNNDDDDPFFQPWEENDNSHHDHFTPQKDDDDDPDNQNDDDDFEFAFVLRDPNSSPVSADDIFYNGQIRPMYMYPLFGAPLDDAVPSASHVPDSSNDEASTLRRRLPLRKLMFEDRETGSCSSSTSENDSADNLEGVPEGTYCVWNPNSVARDRKKSNSTGSSFSSKRWKLRELLLRSHSEGKGKKSSSNSSGGGGGNDDDDKKRAVVFGVPSKRTSKVAATKSGDGYGGASAERDRKSGKKSALPYRQELIGLFANVNGLGRNLNPF